MHDPYPILMRGPPFQKRGTPNYNSRANPATLLKELKMMYAKKTTTKSLPSRGQRTATNKKTMAMKTCASCKSPGKCKAAGKCMGKK